MKNKLRLSKHQLQYYREKGGLLLDIGCGSAKQTNFLGMDSRPLPGVDIVHDLEEFPYPLPDECVLTCIASHVLEHMKPWLTIDIFNEVWRIMKPGGQWLISLPYAGSFGYWQDPTHINGFNEATFTYFDPKEPLFDIYCPMPWKILPGTFSWTQNGNLEVALQKMTVAEGRTVLNARRQTGAAIPGHANQDIGIPTPLLKKKRRSK